MTDLFRSRVSTNVVPVRAPDPAASRSGLAEGLQQAGAQLLRGAQADAQAEDIIAASEDRIAQEGLRRQRSATIADRAGAWAETQASIASERERLRREAPAGGGEYRQQADRVVTEALTGFLGTLGDDPEVRERFAPIVAQFGAQTRLDDERWTIRTRTEYEGAQFGKWQTGAGNRILADPTPQTLQAVFDETDALVDGLDLDGNALAVFKDKAKRGFVTTFLDAQVERGNWAGVRSLVEGKAFDAYLDPEQKLAFGRKADAVEQVAARQAEIAESRLRDEARDAAKAVGAKVDAGIVPTATELRQVRGVLAAAGADPAELVEFDALTVRVDVNRRYATVDAAGTRRDRDLLRARQQAGQASEAEQMMLLQLDRLTEAKDKAETDALRDLIGKSPQATATALSRLTGTPEARYDKAESLEAGLGFVANLTGNAQAYALEGRAVRKARPKDFGDDKQAKAVVDRMLGPIGATIGAQYRDLLETATDIMAAGQVRIGSTGFSEDKMRTAVLMATGATARRNGVVQGGIQKIGGGRPVQLPDNMTPSEFEQYLSRRDFGQAVYGNGRPVSKPDVLRNYRPEWMGDDAHGRPVYRFVDPSGGTLRDKGGASVTMTVAAGL